MGLFLKRSVFGLVLFLGLAMSRCAWAEPVLKTLEPSGSFYVGGTLDVQLVIEWPIGEGDYEIRVPESVRLHNLEFTGLGQSQETGVTSAGRVFRFVATYKFRPIAEGEGVLYAFEIPYKKASGTRHGTISVPRLGVMIKPLLPWKKVLTLILILGVPVLLISLWLVRNAWIDRQNEIRRQSDPKQQIYEEAVLKIGGFVSGFNKTRLKEILSEWSVELKKVVMTYYDIPPGSPSKDEIFKALAAKGLPEGETQEAKTLFQMLEHMTFSASGANDREVSKMQSLLLNYVKGKIIAGQV